MRRRAALRAGIGFVGLGAAGVLATRPFAGPLDVGGAGYRPLDSIDLPGAADCRVSDDGATAFVAVGDGFVAVEVPSLDPRIEVRSIEADREGGPLTNVADLAIDADRLLVPGPANPQPDRLAGVALYDVADPADPAQRSFYETGFPIHNAALEDGLAYLTAGQFLVVLDMVDDPVEVGRWSLAEIDPRWDDVHPALRVLHDVLVREEVAVLSLWDAGTWLVDVSSPDDMTAIGRAGGRAPDVLADVPDEAVRREAVQPPGNHHSAALSADGSLLAIGMEAFDAGTDDGAGGPGGIDLYDIADPSAPSPLATIDAPRSADETPGGIWTTAHDFAFAGDRLISAWYQGGVRIHDVSNPAAPIELAWWRAPAEAAFWTAQPAIEDTFVAPSTTLAGGHLRAGLYLFPNRAGAQVDPPSLTESVTPSEPPTPTRTRTPTPSPRQTRTPGQPGFSHAAATGGLAGMAAWRRLRRRETGP